MSDAPVVASPAANMCGTAVWSVCLSATRVPLLLTGTTVPNAEASVAMPIATMTVSQGMTNSLPLIASGRRRPEPIKGSEFVIPCDTVIVAIGMAPEDSAFGSALPVNANGTLVADKRTLQTAIPHIFAAGDATTGASDITRAVGQGRRAAHMIDRWLNHEPLAGFDMDDLLPLVDKQKVLDRQKLYTRHGEAGVAVPANGARDFAEIEAPLTEAEARASAGDCLDCGVCSECGECVTACPSDAIHLDMREQIEEVDVGAVVVATGYKLFTADAKPEYGFGRYKNVITGMQMDRLLAPTRPFNTVLRPGDGKIPERIAYIL